jgi:protein gp37
VALNSAIEWTEATWNPVTGCSKISPGCKHCYAARMAARLKAMGSERYRNGFDVTLQPDSVDLPLSWRTPKLIFVNSMSDLFHAEVPDHFIFQVFEVMAKASWHTFQVLTKRADRLQGLASRLLWSPNIWMGVSVETEKYFGRIQKLMLVPAAVRFLSLEPLLGPLCDLPLSRIDWVIVGGESGPGARPMQRDWVTSIRTQCNSAGVPFFFKQWGGVRKKKNGRELDGKTYDAMPPLLSANSLRSEA